MDYFQRYGKSCFYVDKKTKVYGIVDLVAIKNAPNS